MRLRTPRCPLIRGNRKHDGSARRKVLRRAALRFRPVFPSHESKASRGLFERSPSRRARGEFTRPEPARSESPPRNRWHARGGYCARKIRPFIFNKGGFVNNVVAAALQACNIRLESEY